MKAFSAIVVLLNLVALAAPLRAGHLECLEGYELDFVWDTMTWVRHPLNFEILYPLGGVALLSTALIHLHRFISGTSNLPILIAGLTLQLITRILVDLMTTATLTRPATLDLWQAFQATGGLSSIASLVLQTLVITALIRGTRAPNNQPPHALQDSR